MFPTIQTDMQNPELFGKSVVIAYIVMLIFYLPVAIGAFIVFSTQLQDNVIDNLSKNWIRTVVLVLITGHVLSAFNIILNPLYQGIENALKAPESITWIKKCILKNLINIFF